MFTGILRRSFVLLVGAALMMGGAQTALAQRAVPPINLPDQPRNQPDVNSPDMQYRSGHFERSATLYAELLKAKPDNPAAHAGLIRSFLRMHELDDAERAANAALKAYPTDPAVLAALGDYFYRNGDMAVAEREYLRAKQGDPKEFHAYLGLAAIYDAYSLHGKAFEELKKAHELAPHDPEVLRKWFAHLPRKERLAELEAYLAAPHPDDAAQTAALQHQVEYLKETANGPVHACRVTSKVDHAEMNLDLSMSDAKHAQGYSLKAKINDHGLTLLVDTGASGILLTPREAEKAGVARLAEGRLMGIGDEGIKGLYYGYAKSIRVGAIEFQDCVVRVAEKSGIINSDGLIGLDVFSNFLVDLDMPRTKLKLSALPPRPGEKASDALATPVASLSDAEQDAAPLDRYIDPTMESWIRVFRVGNHLFIPTSVNDSRMRMFLLDTGARENALSVRAAAKATGLEAEDWVKMRGLSGDVSKVYKADKVTLKFGRYQQPNYAIYTFDLSNLSRNDGVEVSGIMGMSLLHIFDMKIDYRDGLVDLTAPQTNTNF